MFSGRSVVLVVAVMAASWSQVSAVPQVKPGGYILERDADVAKNEPGTHKGGGETIGYSFFAKAPGLKMVFRKRALKPGSGIGYHEQKRGRDLLCPQRPRRHDHRRQELRGHAGDCRVDAARQLTRPEAVR
jgi:hypothetical protein